MYEAHVIAASALSLKNSGEGEYVKASRINSSCMGRSVRSALCNQARNVVLAVSGSKSLISRQASLLDKRLVIDVANSGSIERIRCVPGARLVGTQRKLWPNTEIKTQPTFGGNTFELIQRV